MIDLDKLLVWHEQTLVGVLWQDSLGQIGFRYDQKWLDQGFSISQQLPLTQIEFNPERKLAHQFFANLLPEGGARAHIVRDLKIEDSDFSLLRALGGECAGALSLLPLEQKPNPNFHYTPFGKDTLETLIKQKGQMYGIHFNDDRPRLSLAGAQDKCPILEKNNHYYLPQKNAPSTHILKFEISHYKHIPAYEYFLSQCAKMIGLPVVETTLKRVGSRFYLIVKRYDRNIKEDNSIVRIHQEDFCQALGIGYQKKYQESGGPSFSDCFQLIQNVSHHPIEDAENLLKWHIFNVLAGNSDGHAKNLSLLYQNNKKPRLAPFYDLVCTRAIERVDVKLAMSVGSEYDPRKISLKHWEQLANDCSIKKNYLLDLIEKTKNSLQSSIQEVRKNFEKKFGAYPALQRVLKVINKQLKFAQRL